MSSNTRHSFRPARTGVWIFQQTDWQPGTLVLCCLMLSLAVACGEGASSPPEDLVARVEGEAVPRSELEAFFRDHRDDTAETPGDDALQSRLFDRFLDEKLLQRLALEKGFVPISGGSNDRQKMIAFLLSTSRPENLPKEEVLAWYEDHAERYQRPDQVHLRQILVAERSEAEGAKAALHRGEDFEQVAAQFSQGPMSDLGGDQGRLSRGDLPPDFVDTIFALEPGAVSDIVEADYGFHIFQVMAFHPAEFVPFEAVEEEIRRELWRQKADQLLNTFFKQARERYNVEIFDNNLSFEYRGNHAS